MILLLLACSFVLIDIPCRGTTPGGSGSPGDDTGDSAPFTDSGECGAELLYADEDGDGYGAAPGEVRCPTEGWVKAGDDCDDTDATVFPGAPERCDGRSDACDPGWVDDAHLATFTDLSGVSTTWEDDAATDLDPLVLSLTTDGALDVCAGSWYWNLALTGQVDVHGIEPEAILDGAGAGPALTLGAGSFEVRGLTIQNGRGGIVVDGADEVDLLDLTVSGNSAVDGAGLAVEAAGQVRLTDVRFERNVASERGGGARLAGVVDMTRVTFEQNEAAFGGGFSAAPHADISLTDSLLADNVASARGGGVYAEAEGPTVLTLVDTDVRGGSAASGGGLYGSDLTLACTGAIDLDAGVHDNEAQQVYLTGAKWQFDADACDLGLSDGQGEVLVEGAGSWVYGEDATFHCDPTGCR